MLSERPFDHINIVRLNANNMCIFKSLKRLPEKDRYQNICFPDRSDGMSPANIVSSTVAC